MSVMGILRQLHDSFSCPRAPGVAVLARFPPKVHDGRLGSIVSGLETISWASRQRATEVHHLN